MASVSPKSPDEVVDPDVRELAEELRKDRQHLTFWRRPLTVTYHAVMVLVEEVVEYGAIVTRSKAFLYVVVPLCVGWYTLAMVEGGWSPFLHELHLWIWFAVWWFGLGVASSVGLGTGMHSGLLFLFPHIFKVCLDSQHGHGECGHLGFDTRENMWWHMGVEHHFACDPTGPESTYWNTVWKVLPACLLWGTGTAVGEIPPYAISRAAALAGESDKDFEAIVNTHPSSRMDVVGALKEWMVRFLQTHGFIGVLLMSAWPNAFFDLCGICCGHFLMPFWPFFTALWLGKAGIKVNMQAMLFVGLFRPSSRDALVASIHSALAVFGERGETVGVWMVGKVHDAVDKLRHTHPPTHHPHHTNATAQTGAAVGLGDDDDDDESLLEWAGFVWRCVVVLLVALFVISCLEQVAKQRRVRLDRLAVERALHER